MPASFSRIGLSASVDGDPIPIVNIATPGTLVHTAIPSLFGWDVLYLSATNVTGLAVPITIEWGGTAVGNHVVHNYLIPANSPAILVVSGLMLQNGRTVTVFAGTTNAINISGLVDRIQ